MPVSSTLDHVYAYNGSVASLSLGSLINASVVNFSSGRLHATLTDDDGVLDLGDSGSTTAAINGGTAQPLTYLGSGWSATAIVLGAPVLPKPAVAFKIGAQIYIHFPSGPPVLSGVLIGFKLSTGAAFSLPNPTVICLADGALILTPGGQVPVERLRPGDLVLTADHGAQPLRWIGRRTVGLAEQSLHPAMGPVRIARGALGPELPRRGLWVSRQHRLLVAADAAGPQGLLAACLLPERPGIGPPGRTRALIWHHLLFDRHEVIFAEGIAVESLYLGPRMAATLDGAAREEVAALFPDLPRLIAGERALCPAPARPILRRSDLRAMGERASRSLRGFGPEDLQPRCKAAG